MSGRGTIGRWVGAAVLVLLLLVTVGGPVVGPLTLRQDVKATVLYYGPGGDVDAERVLCGTAVDPVFGAGSECRSMLARQQLIGWAITVTGVATWVALAAVWVRRSTRQRFVTWCRRQVAGIRVDQEQRLAASR